jgi:hypothetical protein
MYPDRPGGDEFEVSRRSGSKMNKPTLRRDVDCSRFSKGDLTDLARISPPRYPPDLI